MNALAEELRSEIERGGPLKFGRFMDQCLYHPQYGYYRRDRFGAAGDFYTAEQLQPVFGRLAAEWIRQCGRELGNWRPTVVELGAGRREMRDAFAAFDYQPVDIDSGELPSALTGIVFSNEFFDAIPVDVVHRRADQTVERRVEFDGERFVWVDGPAVNVQLPDDIEVLELQDRRVEWMTRIASSLTDGFVISIDYGYTRRELVRFPQGTLMSYQRHLAQEDVLSTPGERDITAHVDFTALQEAGERAGLETIRYESLASALLRAGEADNFASALEGGDEREVGRRRLQLKSLLFGMGETFRVLWQRKRGVCK